MNILIVDDSALMRGIIRQVIRDNLPAHRIGLIEASNGREAIAAMGCHEIDLVLVDWSMPIVDGVRFVRQVRSEGTAIPIIMVSAVNDEERVYEAAQAGVSSYIQKPVRGSELWDKLKGYVS